MPTRIPVHDVRPWTPEDPHLYDVTVTLGDGPRLVVHRDAELRGPGSGRLLLNGAPFAHVGVLDQGYWPDGLLTPPADDALVHDITQMKDLGFTVLRKHVKVEPLRWYHHCDRLGMVVWQDMVNGGGRYRWLTTQRPARHASPFPDRLHRLFGREDRRGREEFRREVRETVELLRNVVSIAVWTPYNEGWGQFAANAVAREVARLDPTRQVNHVSGWVDQGGGDIRSFHRYLRPFAMPRRRGRRVLALTEYGGASLRVEGHDWSDQGVRLPPPRGLRRVRARSSPPCTSRWSRPLAQVSPPPSTPSSATSRTSSTGCSPGTARCSSSTPTWSVGSHCRSAPP